MSWNYRLVKIKTDVEEEPFYYEVREVYYEEDGSIRGVTDLGISFGGSTPEEVAESLEMALKDVMERSILELPLVSNK